MPSYGVNFDDEAHQIVTRGLDMPADGSMPNRSERVNELVKLGGAVEESLRGTGFPRRGRDLSDIRGDVAMVIEQGVKRCQELDLM